MSERSPRWASFARAKTAKVKTAKPTEPAEPGAAARLELESTARKAAPKVAVPAACQAMAAASRSAPADLVSRARFAR